MYKVIGVLFLIMFSSIPCFSAWDGEITLIEPPEIRRCLKDPKLNDLIIATDFNPFYLRGDFDGDNKTDYAVWMHRSVGAITGVVVCAGNNSIHLLGSGIAKGENFSDMEKDDFLPLRWEVTTKQEIDELATWKCNIPDPFPKIENESIKLVWREGESAIIYWDGKQYKWTAGFTLESREGCTIE